MIDFPDDVFQPTPSKIVLLVVDGLGGIPHPDTGMSELETASLPNLDRLAQRSAAGVTTPVAPGCHARQRTRPHRPLRVRSSQVHGGQGSARGPGHRRRAGRGRRGRPREFLHGRRVGRSGRPAGGPNPNIRECAAGRHAKRDRGARSRDCRPRGEGLPLRPGHAGRGTRRRGT